MSKITTIGLDLAKNVFHGFCLKRSKDPNLVRSLVPVTQPSHRAALQATDGLRASSAFALS